MVGCEYCGEAITFADEPAQSLGVMGKDGQGRVGFVHRECHLREIVGGIGHLIAHPYWCIQHHDPDAGLTTRQSSLLVDAWVQVMGVEAVGQAAEIHSELD
jgi:hypothetical protein